MLLLLRSPHNLASILEPYASSDPLAAHHSLTLGMRVWEARGWGKARWFIEGRWGIGIRLLT